MVIDAQVRLLRKSLTMPRRAPARGYRTAIVNELARAHALLAQGPLLFPQ